MASVIQKLDKFIDDNDLDNEDNIDEYEEIDGELISLMFDLITSLTDEQITDDQADMIAEILDMIDPDDDGEMDESLIDEVFKKRVRRDLSTARQRRREYRRKRAQIKIKARKYRRSAHGKQTLRKAKRYKKIGRTSTKKRQRKFVGPQLSKFK